METRLHFDILPQPDDSTCGPTCLHAVYRYFGDEIPLQRVIEESHRLKEGGTLAVLLACHALRRGYRAVIYTYNLQMFDPTWFQAPGADLIDRLQAQRQVKTDRRLQIATEGYIEFLTHGGQLRFQDLTPELVRRYLRRAVPILTGLSSTYLYRTMREYGPRDDDDDVRGEPAGHFVVLCGYDKESRSVLVADPLVPNPAFERRLYQVSIDRLICAILLGILTYDANLLIIEPERNRGESAHATSDHR